jgi:hypothetical protein
MPVSVVATVTVITGKYGTCSGNDQVIAVHNREDAVMNGVVALVGNEAVEFST